ncbi:MAG TPA: tetratricopeptide repeat protein [Bacteroides sp.]|nr:tetratricopeptide repeat protein [Bacteroides sp.]
MIKNISLWLFFLVSATAWMHARDARIDSLKSVLELVKTDTARVNKLNEIAYIVFRTDSDEAISYGSEAKLLAEQIDFRKGIAEACKNIGLGYYMKGNYSEAFRNWDRSLEAYQELGDDQGVANILGNQGSIFLTLGQNVQAIEYYLRALKIAERLKDSTRIATLLVNIGLLYSEQPGAIDTARSYYQRAMAIGESIGYTADLMGVGMLNMGELYFMEEAYDTALYYFEKSLAIFRSRIDLSTPLNFIGRVYTEKGDYQSALQYHTQALEMAMSEGAMMETARGYLGLAYLCDKQEDPRQAIRYYEQARSIAEEIEANYELSAAYGGLAYAHAALSDYRKAFEFLSLQKDIDDELYREDADNKANNLVSAYRLEKKQDEIEILEQQSIIEQLKSKRQRAVLMGTGIIGLLLLLLAGGLYSRFRFVRKTNRQIKEQRDEIESQRNEIQAQRDQLQAQHDLVLKQKEMITDSINYAQNIQSALLPTKTMMDELMPEYFVLFKPKDIVSGDFYWIKEVQDHLVLVGADCTGHGVPGAFMSMLGITLLNSMIGDRCFDAPAAILEQLRLKVKEMLLQEGKVEEQKDGMDMAIAILNKHTRELHYSGANNPLYIIRRKDPEAGQSLVSYASLENGEFELFEIKGDKQPIGIHWEETDFTSHSVTLRSADTIYVFSDGFIDQFGGENRKKFKSMNFKKLLLSIQKEPMERQRRIIEETFETWRGSNEQIDDVSVLGVRI